MNSGRTVLASDLFVASSHSRRGNFSHVPSFQRPLLSSLSSKSPAQIAHPLRTPLVLFCCTEGEELMSPVFSSQREQPVPGSVLLLLCLCPVLLVLLLLSHSQALCRLLHSSSLFSIWIQAVPAIRSFHFMLAIFCRCCYLSVAAAMF